MMACSVATLIALMVAVTLDAGGLWQECLEFWNIICLYPIQILSVMWQFPGVLRILYLKVEFRIMKRGILGDPPSLHMMRLTKKGNLTHLSVSLYDIANNVGGAQHRGNLNRCLCLYLLPDC